MKTWYYVLDGTQHGPVETDEIRAMLASGMIHRDSLIWREGMEEWQPLGAVPEWTGQLVSASPVAYPGGTAVAQTSGLAIASLVCGISSVILLTTCFLGIIAGVPAVICGHMALNQISRAYPPVAGRGMAIAGLVTGYLSLAIPLAIGLFFLFGISLIA